MNQKLRFFAASMLTAGLMFFSLCASAQQTVSGVITSSDDKTALPGVNILVKGSTRGTTTDADGKYSIEVSEGAILQFSFIGYATQEVTVGTQTSINVMLINDVSELDEVVVIGYGEIKKSDLTGAVSSVSAKDLGDRSATSVADLLQGRAAGVEVSNSTIRIRGTNSINSGTGPLYIIDGLLGGNPDLVHPSDIENIEVLKDAASTAIYGSAGANGVIIINTKKGKTGAPQFQYNNFFAVSRLAKRIDLLNSQQYMELLKDIELNGGTTMAELTAKTKLFNADGTFTEYATTDRTDWQDEMFQDGAFQEHNLSLRGASDLVNYSVSGAINSGESTVGTSDWKNYKLGINTNWNLFNNRLRIGEDFRMQYYQNTGRGVDLLGGLRMPQYAPVEDPNALGGFAYVTTTDDLNDASNPVTDLRLGSNLDQGASFNLNLKAELMILKGLTLHSSFGILGSNSSTYAYIKPRQNGNLVYPDAQLDENISFGYETILENYLTYKKQIKDHDFSLMVGNTVKQPVSNRGIDATGIGYVNDAVITLDVAREKTVASNDIGVFGWLGYFGRVTYAFKNKYLLSANIRRDGSDKFGSLNKYGTFPAVAVGWKLSEESFIQSIPAISFLKLRAGYGITGNDQITSFGYVSQVHSNVAYAFPSRTSNTYNGATINSAYNPAIQWEEVASVSVGVEIGLFNDRIFFTADYFDKETRKMIVDIPLPPSLGFGNNGGGGNANVNAGNLANRGWEFTLTTKNSVGDLNYNVSGNVTFLQNEVTNLAGGVPYNDGGLGGFGTSNRTEEGYEVGYFYGYKMDRVYATQEQVNADNEAARARAVALDPTLTDADLEQVYFISSSTKAGDIRFLDLDGDGVVTAEDRTNLGSSIPKTSYGFTTSLAYKNFDFFMNWTGRAGNKILYELGYWMEGMIRPFNSSTETLNRWRSEADPGDGITPRAVKTDPSGNLRMSDRFIYSGSYLRLSLVSLGYSLPPATLNAAFRGYVKGIRVYVSSDTPLTITKYRGYDPEVGGNVGQRARGRDTGYLPVSRTFRAGLQLTF